MEPPILWSPRPDARSRVGDYLDWLVRARGLTFDGYHDLWRWSVADLEGFWTSIAEYFDLDLPGPALAQDRLPGAAWFPNARLNYAARVLAAPGVAPDDPIMIAHSQTRAPITLTLAELWDETARVAAGLRKLGVGPGDRVVAYAPNIPETYILLLASASLGAIFSSCAPEFGTTSVIDRWQQIAPVVLVAIDGYRYGGRAHDRGAEVAAIRAALPTLKHTVTIPYLGETEPDTMTWAELRAVSEPLEPVALPFDHPLYILFSSGTTGLPKPIVHGHGGILLEHLKMLALHHDLGQGDRFFWYTTTGWMMWNYLASGPAVGSAIVLYDGNPAWPDLGALWRFAAESGVTYFGTAAPFLLACRKAGITPPTLPALRGVGSTGAPLPPEGFRWVYDSLGPQPLLASLSGGTDVCTGFVGGSPLLPVYEGEIACRCLGAAVEAHRDGQPVLGEQGELVITRPMPSMPVGFWGDPDGQRYRDAYFPDGSQAWRHGDWITITERDTCVITGRSDATLNRGGVRLGTAEFYSVVEALPEVADSLVIHTDTDQLLLFVALAPGAELDDAVRRKLVDTLRTQLSPRHVPDAIHQVPAIPRTLSGKKLEVPIKRILAGVPPAEAVAEGALANPAALAPFVRQS